MKLLLLALLLLPALAHAKKHRIVQVDKTFLGDITDQQAQSAFEDPTIEETHKVETLDAAVGDTIEFANRDEVNHNVSAAVDGATVFDVKLQAPGKAQDRSIELKRKGDYSIQCAIHPKMKIKLRVK